jgi:signal transduction histidine kinase/CheY-like chemotaxis protein
MNESIGGFQSNMRITYKWALVGMVISGMALIAISDLPTSMFFRSELQYLAILMYIFTGLIWILDRWKQWLGKSALIVLLAGVIFLGNYWLEIPGFLTLLILPTILAAAFMGLRATTAATAGETLALLGLNAMIEPFPGEIMIPLIAIWSVLVMMFVIYLPMYQVIEWVWDFYEQTQIALGDARNHKAQLALALEDLTRTNRQMVLANEKMKNLRQIAEESRKNKVEFVSRVSHEFRTPLNIIIGMVNLMVNSPQVYQGEFPPKARKQLDVVYRNCQHLANMINDVLDLSQSEAGLMILNRQPTNLHEVIETSYQVVQPLLEEKKLDWQLLIPDNLPEIYCDRTRIRQVILNLLSNAARYTSEGGITLRVTQAKDHIQVSVADTGLGIASEDASKLFKPFSQISDFVSASGGSGLGLSISKQFVELHDGKMWLESEVGVGTTFFFELPISPLIGPLARAGHWIQEDWEWSRPQSLPELPDSHFRPRVVVYDETADIYSLLVRSSDEIEFINSQVLSQAIREMKEMPAQALIINAPSPNTLLPLVDQARDKLHNTPIIGTSYPFRMKHILEAGAVDYLAKPISLEDLKTAIQKLDIDIRRVMIVDDTPDVRDLLLFYLQTIDENLDVIATENGEQALSEMSTVNPDLLLLDLVMPIMDGWEFLKRKEQDPTICEIPTILISAQDLSEGHSTSDIFMATIGEGISLNKMLGCTRDFIGRMMMSD